MEKYVQKSKSNLNDRTSFYATLVKGNFNNKNNKLL